MGRKGGRSHAAVWYPMRVVKLGLSFTKELQVLVVLSDREFHATDPVPLAQRLAAKPRPNQPRPLRAAINLDPSLCLLGTSAITSKWAPLLDVQIKAGSVCNHVSNHVHLYYEDAHHLALVRRQIRETAGKEGDLRPSSS